MGYLIYLYSGMLDFTLLPILLWIRFKQPELVVALAGAIAMFGIYIFQSITFYFSLSSEDSNDIQAGGDSLTMNTTNYLANDISSLCGIA